MNLTPTQKSHVPSEAELKQIWLLVDVNGKTLGRIATQIADLLRGKGKPHFTPKTDCGDYVVVVNAEKVRLTKNKVETKLYHWHTRYPAGFRTRSAKELLETNPEKILFDAVSGMLPRNKLRKHFLRKLRVFAGAEHTMKAQSPKPIELN